MSMPQPFDTAKLDPRIVAIARKGDFDITLQHASEEFAEAAAACAKFYRARVYRDGGADRIREFVEEVADLSIMLEELLSVSPQLRAEMPVIREWKIERSMRRYGVTDADIENVTQKGERK